MGISNSSNQLEQPKSKGMKWWQWILKYPTLVLFILASIPYVKIGYQALRLQVPPNEVSRSLQQLELWNENRNCLQQKATTNIIESQDHLKTTAIICPNQDVLLTFTWTNPLNPNDIKQDYQWISPRKQTRWVTTIEQSSTNQFLTVFQPAIATNLNHLEIAQAQKSETVICQKYSPDKKQVILYIKTSDGKCFKRTIQKTTGELVSQISIDCKKAALCQ